MGFAACRPSTGVDHVGRLLEVIETEIVVYAQVDLLPLTRGLSRFLLEMQRENGLWYHFIEADGMFYSRQSNEHDGGNLQALALLEAFSFGLDSTLLPAVARGADGFLRWATDRGYRWEVTASSATQLHSAVPARLTPVHVVQLPQ